jgi:hypothetical protein
VDKEINRMPDEREGKNNNPMWVLPGQKKHRTETSGIRPCLLKHVWSTTNNTPDI